MAQPARAGEDWNHRNGEREQSMRVDFPIPENRSQYSHNASIGLGLVEHLM